MFSLTLAAVDVDTASNLAMWSFLIGAFLPTVVALVQQPRWPEWVRAFVNVGACLLAGAGVVYFAGDFAWDEDLVGSILRVLIASQATYVAFWKKTGIAPQIEAATSPDARVLQVAEAEPAAKPKPRRKTATTRKTATSRRRSR